MTDSERWDLIRHLRRVHGWWADFETWPEASLVWLHERSHAPQ